MLFSEVAEHLSFTLAASKLEVSRGHLSSQIRRLEKEMGLALFIRSTRSVRLTPEGERVLTWVNKIRQDLLDLERNAEHDVQAVEGLIKITAPKLFTQRYLLDICKQFKAIHNNITFSIDCSYTNFDLNRSKYDLAFRATNEPPENMIAKQLFSYKHVCCASPEYFKKFSQPLITSDLVHHRCLRGQETQEWTFVNDVVPVNAWLEVNDTHLLKSLAIEGEGIIKVPEYLVEDELKSGELAALFIDEMPLAFAIYMIHPQLFHQSNRLSTFIEFTRRYFKAQRDNSSD
jgi:DNA-binding transcriptional LysR family regulator